jgi:hypothetical protein
VYLHEDLSAPSGVVKIGGKDELYIPLLITNVILKGDTKMEKYTLPVVIEKDEYGYFAMCPALQGCYSQGDTYEEAIKYTRMMKGKE